MKENNTIKDPKKRVGDFLTKHGFPLEMLVANTFRRYGFEVFQSPIYEDPITGKHREVDALAYFSRVNNDVVFQFTVIIECKFAKNLWVLFTGEKESYQYLGLKHFYCGNFAGGELLDRLSPIPQFLIKPVFKLANKPGYGVTEAHDQAVEDSDKTSDGRASFKAINTIINYLKYVLAEPTTTKEKVFEVFIPVVVIQGKLFEAYLDAENEQQVNELVEGQLIYKSNVLPDVFPVINIITRDVLEDYVQKLVTDILEIMKQTDIINSLTINYPRPPLPMVH